VNPGRPLHIRLGWTSVPRPSRQEIDQCPDYVVGLFLREEVAAAVNTDDAEIGSAPGHASVQPLTAAVGGEHEGRRGDRTVLFGVGNVLPPRLVLGIGRADRVDGIVCAGIDFAIRVADGRRIARHIIDDPVDQ
jgi:hypothetical protein